MATRSPLKKSGKKKRNSRRSSDTVATFVPSPTVKILGKQVIAQPESHKAFRKKASVAGKFEEELKKNKQYQQLEDSADIAFCEGWLHLARLEFGPDPDQLDHQLVTRLKAALYHDGPDIVSG